MKLLKKHWLAASCISVVVASTLLYGLVGSVANYVFEMELCGVAVATYIMTRKD